MSCYCFHCLIVPTHTLTACANTPRRRQGQAQPAHDRTRAPMHSKPNALSPHTTVRTSTRAPICKNQMRAARTRPHEHARTREHTCALRCCAPATSDSSSAASCGRRSSPGDHTRTALSMPLVASSAACGWPCEQPAARGRMRLGFREQEALSAASSEDACSSGSMRRWHCQQQAAKTHAGRMT